MWCQASYFEVEGFGYAEGGFFEGGDSIGVQGPVEIVALAGVFVGEDE